jgi:replicative DNA helicase
MERATGKALAGRYTDDLKSRWSGESRFVSTGYDALDEVLKEGFAPGVFAVVCGRTRNGKTMFVVDMIRRLLKGDPKPRILVWPLEVGVIRFMDMLVSSVSGVDSEMLIRRPEEMGLDDRGRVQEKINKLIGSDDRLVVMDNPFYELGSEWTNDNAMGLTERVVAAGGWDIVISDLWDRKLVDHRPQALTTALFREQAMCQKYGFCSIAVHQLRRDIEKEKDKRPQLIHLKGSGAWEEVAGLVLGVHRERAYKPRMLRDDLEVEVLKQKMGDLGDVMVAGFEPWHCRLVGGRLGSVGEDRQPKFGIDDESGNGGVL